MIVGVAGGVALAACIAATAGICAGVAAGIVVAVVAGAGIGAASSATTYALLPGEKTTQGWFEALAGGAGLGALTGGIGPAANSVIRAGQITATQQVVSSSLGSGAGVVTNSTRIVLGLREGLDDVAQSVGGQTLLDDPAWQQTLQTAIADPSTEFVVVLDGLEGSNTYAQVMSAAQRGAAPAATATNWELAQLYQAGRLGSVTFVRGGVVVDNPWP